MVGTLGTLVISRAEELAMDLFGFTFPRICIWLNRLATTNKYPIWTWDFRFNAVFLVTRHAVTEKREPFLVIRAIRAWIPFSATACQGT